MEAGKMREFLKLAEGISAVPIVHWAHQTNTLALRLNGNMSPGWLECHTARNFVLDLMRQVEGVGLYNVEILNLGSGSRTPIEQKDGYTNYLLGLLGDSVGLQGMQETGHLLPGSVWWVPPHDMLRITNNGVEDAMVLLIQIQLDT
jgi:hypothetical protein